MKTTLMTILLQFIKFTLRLQKFTKVHTPTIFYTSLNTYIKKEKNPFTLLSKQPLAFTKSRIECLSKFDKNFLFPFKLFGKYFSIKAYLTQQFTPNPQTLFPSRKSL